MTGTEDAPVPRPDAILFDLDGTLCDSLGDIHRALHGARRAAGLAGVEPEDVRRWVGHGAARLVARSLGTEDEGDPRVAPLLARFRHHYDLRSGERTTLYPGVRELLEFLRGEGIVLAVATNKPLGPTRRLLDALGVGDAFAAVVAPESVGGATKPDPRLFAHALDAVAVAAPAHALVVGDGLPDILGARAVGASVAAVLGGYGDPAALRAAGADHYLRQTADLGPRLAPRTPGPLALLVEDHPELLRMYATALEAAGFRVRSARGPTEALLHAAEAEPDVLVLDGELPGMHGAVLFSLLERGRPDLASRTLLVTGLAASPPVERLLAERPVSLLEKPFRPRELVDACRRLAALR